MRIWGIVLTVLGTIAMLAGFTVGLFQFVDHDAKVIASVPVTLFASEVGESSLPFSVQGHASLSLWLKVPGRAIETEDMTINTNFVGSDGFSVARVNKEFGFFHTRTSVPGGQLYKLGEQNFTDGFVGYLRVERISNWNPDYEASLLLKRIEAGAHDKLMIYAGVVLMGALLLTMGVFFMPS